MLKKFRQLTKVEKLMVAFFILVIMVTGYRIARAFYDDYSDISPETGGLYVEGAVGKIGQLNPLLVQQGSVTHDLTDLIFSGLTQYDPKSGTIIPNLADFTMSSSGREYTFVIREGAKWHEGTPVTSDDVIFTYETVLKDPSFKGAILNANDYRGIRVMKLDSRTVKFLLEKPNAFFLTKAMTGILPAHLLGNTPPSALAEDPFNLSPTGSGRYQFVSMLPVDDHVEISLEAFAGFYGTIPHIESLLFKVFPDEGELAKHLSEVDGVRTVSESLTEKIFKRSGFVLERYHLPQYVAVFINNDSPILKNKKVRLALQLGTDKASLIEAIGESQIIDTPLLEIDQENWVHQFNLKSANGALYDTEWKLPGVQEAEANAPETKEEKTEEEPTYINGSNGGRDFKTTENKVTITGTAPARTNAILVNDYELQKFAPGDKGWSYVASEEFGNLKRGDNVFEVSALDYQEKKTFLDRITVTYNNSIVLQQQEKEKLAKENEEFSSLPTRKNQKGESLKLRFITSQTPAVYAQIAELLQDQWKRMGVELEIDVLDPSTFQERLMKRDYDLLLFGQNLGYNLDSYPYWHSSQAKEGGYNLSQFKNFGVDSLLEAARLEEDEGRRKVLLSSIQRILSQEVPAVFLYSPTYSSAHAKKIQNVSFTGLATMTDRFANIEEWYAQGKRQFKEGVTPWTFVTWFFEQF
ncbi:MAG: peptide ABC transporter substrate-binding protein [Candidatus Peregrinibacteria bacterium]